MSKYGETSETFEHEVVCESGNEYLLTCVVTWGCERDGADADGNRGWDSYYIEVEDVECSPSEIAEEDEYEVDEESGNFYSWCENATPSN